MSEKKETIYAVQLDLVLRTSEGKEITISRDMESNDDVMIKPHTGYASAMEVSESVIRALQREIKNLKKFEPVFPKPEEEAEEE